MKITRSIPILFGILVQTCFIACNSDKKNTEFNKNVDKRRLLDTLPSMTPLVLWYTSPALQRDTLPYGNGQTTNAFGDGEGKGWEEALPVGNGRLGAMVFGGIKRERIQLNESSLWTGKYVENKNEELPQIITQIRKLIFESKFSEAQNLAETHLTGNIENRATYQSLGDLIIQMDDLEDDSKASDYYRDLHIDSAIATVHFHVGEKLITREIFASYPDNVIIIHIKSDKPASLNFTASMFRESDAETFRSPFDTTLLIQRGIIPSNGLNFESQLKAVYYGGTVRNETRKLVVKNADSVTLILSAATSYDQPNHALYAKQLLLAAVSKPYHVLKRDHIKSYKKLFQRVDFELTSAEKAYDMPTDKRLERAKNGFFDKYLTELLFQYGRYLLISSSRPGFLPANMQGIWNEHLNPLYGSGYETNWTLPLTYAPADATGLSELKRPLINLVDTLAETGAKAAKSLYNSIGWLAHDFVSIHGNNLPTSLEVESASPMGAVWLSNTLFETFEYTQDKELLKQEIYPLIKGAALFVLEDLLVKVPKGLPGESLWVVSPALSAGNAYTYDETQKNIKLGYGSAIDQQLVRQLFSNVIKAIDALSTKSTRYDPTFRARISDVLQNLAGVSVSTDSTLQDWLVPMKPNSTEMEYIPSLYGLYPGNTLHQSKYQYALKTLQKNIKNLKKQSNTYPLLACWFATIGESETGTQMLQKHIQYQTALNLMSSTPPFKMDGNTAFTAAICQHLVAHNNDGIILTPALPAIWGDGYVKGIRAKGGFNMNIYWKSTDILVELRNPNGGMCKLKVGKNPKVMNNGDLVPITKDENGNIVFPAIANELYTIEYTLQRNTNTKKSDSGKGLGILPDLGLGIDLGIRL